jgi:formylglycine-generating enzyme required for sulfatase activity
MRLQQLSGLLATVVVSVACSSSSPPAGPSSAGGASSICPAGSERCACYGNGTCDEGLQCLSDLCVAGTSGGSTDADGAAPTGGTATSTGGVTAVAETLSSGGTPSTGGSMGTRGTLVFRIPAATGGTTHTGGTTSVGGTEAAGGATQTGGTTSVGGTKAAGGTSPNGTTTAAGGTKSTGGATAGTAGAASCTINSEIYSSGDSNPSNSCQTCQPAISTKNWVALSEGASCDAGKVCASGNCKSGCWIGSAYYASGANHGPCQSCQPATSTTKWTSDSTSCGCTGSLESIQSSTGLCVAKMAPIASARGTYSIDATEVTRGQYDLWLATNPALPGSTDDNCSYVASYVEQSSAGILWVAPGDDAAHYPVADVDWCDAYAYCKGVGKRLCGAINGGTNAFANASDAGQSQWYAACSSGGVDIYPYGETFSAQTCDGEGYIGKGIFVLLDPVRVGSATNCVTSTTGFAGAYDLSGNVSEWEDCCTGNGSESPCVVRGGNYASPATASGGLLSIDLDDLTCGSAVISARSYAANTVGFRCCSP